MFIILIIVCIWFITCSVAGYGEALRIKNNSKYSKEWHNFQLLERIGIGLTLFLVGRYIHYWAVIIVVMLFFMISFFIIYDGIINKITFKKEFFYVSETTSAWTEKFASKWIKIPLMFLVAVLNVVLLKVYSEE